MWSSSTSEPSHTPEHTAGGVAAEEELIVASVVWPGAAAARGRGSKKKAGGVGEMGVHAPLPPSSRLLIGSWAEKPMGQAWD